MARWRVRLCLNVALKSLVSLQNQLNQLWVGGYQNRAFRLLLALAPRPMVWRKLRVRSAPYCDEPSTTLSLGYAPMTRSGPCAVLRIGFGPSRNCRSYACDLLRRRPDLAARCTCEHQAKKHTSCSQTRTVRTGTSATTRHRHRTSNNTQALVPNRRNRNQGHPFAKQPTQAHIGGPVSTPSPYLSRKPIAHNGTQPSQTWGRNHLPKGNRRSHQAPNDRQ